MMKFLKRFKGDNLHLKGPNFDSAKEYIVDLSGTKLTFPAPRQTAMMPGHIQRFEFGLNNPNEFEKWNDSENMGFIIHSNGWELTGNKKHAFGYVTIDITLAKIKLENSKNSFFNPSFAIKWLLNDIESDWGERNRETIKDLEELSKGISHEGYLYRYPKSKKELFRLDSLNATYFPILQPRSGIDTQYRIPIDNDLWLYFHFSLRSLDCDFYSPEHNFPEASEKLVKDFMDEVKIELSPEAAAHKQAATEKKS